MMKTMLTKDNLREATRDLSKCAVAATETHSKSDVAADKNHLTSVVAELFSELGIMKEITLEPGIIPQLLNGTCEGDTTPLVQVVKVGSRAYFSLPGKYWT
jgi:hypothetical protein